MEPKKTFLTVALATLVFAVISRILLGSPNVSWGYSHRTSILAFVFWAVYAAVLYGVIKTDTVPFTPRSGTILKSGFFGVLASCINAGINILLMQLIKNTKNLLLAAFFMEAEVLLFGSILILFLYFAVAKRQLSALPGHWISYLAILAGCIGIFILTFAILFPRFQALAPYTSPEFLADSQINLQTLMYMKTAMLYHRKFLTIATILFSVFFITLWSALQKNTKNRKMQRL